MSGDMRVTTAREFLAWAVKHPVADRPVSLLMRECAELRRQLGQVLDVVRESVSLTDDQLVTLGQALGDAIAYRRPEEEGCKGCENHPDAALCDDHAADYSLCDAYTALARELGIEVEL